MEKSCRALEQMSAGGGDDGVSTFNYILGLPPSISHEIFFRLPIRDVRRCRSVCKTWRDIISDPDFSVFYANNSKHTPLLYFHVDERLETLYHLYLLEIPDDGGEYLETRIVPNLLPGWFDRAPNLRPVSNYAPPIACYFLREPTLFPSRLGAPYITVVGSCCGFICLKRTMDGCDTVYVTNPIMGCGDLVVLPEVASEKDVRYFFGFSQDRIKVLRYVLETKERARRCEIFTVGSDDRWRSLSVSIGRLGKESEVSDFNGVLHWVPEIVMPNFIYTFDLASEEPGRIPSPPKVALIKEHVQMRALNNRFSLISYYGNCLSGNYEGKDTPEITIWTMHEYGVAESWTKEVILKTSISPRTSGNFINFPTASRDGNLVFAYADHSLVKSIHSYDVHQKTGSKIAEFTSIHIDSYFHSYSPSFYLRADKWCQKDAGESSSRSDIQQE